MGAATEHRRSSEAKGMGVRCDARRLRCNELDDAKELDVMHHIGWELDVMRGDSDANEHNL